MSGGNAKHVLSIERETTLGTKLHRQTFHSVTIQKGYNEDNKDGRWRKDSNNDDCQEIKGDNPH